MALPGRAAAAVLAFVTLATPLQADADPMSGDLSWGLPDDLLATLADRTRTYLEQAPSVECTESLRTVRYRQAKRFVDERAMYRRPRVLQQRAEHARRDHEQAEAGGLH